MDKSVLRLDSERQKGLKRIFEGVLIVGEGCFTTGKKGSGLNLANNQLCLHSEPTAHSLLEIFPGSVQSIDNLCTLFTYWVELELSSDQWCNL